MLLRDVSLTSFFFFFFFFSDVSHFLATAESWESNELTQIAILREAAVETVSKDKKSSKKATPIEKEDRKWNFLLTEAETKAMFGKTKEIKIGKGKQISEEELPRGYFAFVRHWMSCSLSVSLSLARSLSTSCRLAYPF